MEFKKRIKHIDPYSIYKTKFLTLEEQALMKSYFKDLVTFDGGYSNSERKRAYFNSPSVDIVCLKITYNDKYLTLTHQNILGTLLSLNISRDTIGDILVEQGYIYVTKDILPVLLNEFKAINHHSILLSVIDGTDAIREIKLTSETCYIDSMRLDLIVSRFTNKSRNDACFMIENDLVQINHMTYTKVSKTVNENDIISIRKFGRFKVLSAEKRSRKGKIVLNYGKFI